MIEIRGAGRRISRSATASRAPTIRAPTIRSRTPTIHSSPVIPEILHLHHQMKMVGHQAPGEYIAIRHDMGTDFSGKEQVILPAKKNKLPVIALVIYMIYASGFEDHKLMF